MDEEEQIMERRRNGRRAAADGVIYVEWNEAGTDVRAQIEVKLLQFPAGNMLRHWNSREC